MALIGTGAALMFCLATGAAAGVVPMASGASDPSHSVTVALDVVTDAPAAAAAPAPAPAAAAPPVTAPPTTAPRVTTPPATAPRRAASSSSTRTTDPAPAADTAPAASAAPTPATAAESTTVPRTNPSSAQVRSAVSTLGLPITPSESQARQFGDSVCDAFDQGQTFAQVKATALQAANQVPLITVSETAVDGAVRAAVNLFCPGHADKLV